MAVTPLSYLSESTLSIADSASAILSARPVTTATLSTMRYFIYQILKNYDLLTQRYHKVLTYTRKTLPASLQGGFVLRTEPIRGWLRLGSLTV